MPTTFQTVSNHVIELIFNSSKVYSDPFNEIELDLLISSTHGKEMTLPAYWAGGQEWRARFSSFETGHFSFKTACSDPTNLSLHNLTGTIEVKPYSGQHPLYQHGGLRIRPDRNSFEHLDGTPFFWLGDTWWMYFCGRLHWPEEVQRLAADRKKKGFSVVHMVSGLFPDMPPFDPRGANEGGFPWEAGFTTINPAFYDHADLKLQHAVSQGLMPMVVGAWGYFLPIMGIEKMKRHYRYLIARWSAYPIIWCLAGEVTMPWYLSNTMPADIEQQKEGWSEIGQYLKHIDPYQRPITAHTGSPKGDSLGELTDPSILDFNFVQGPHGNFIQALLATKKMLGIVANTSLKPIVNGETCYEHILGSAHQDVQRFLFWSNFLSGVVGYSYGANGLWQLNRPEQPYGPSLLGMAWGGADWEGAMHYPGSTQLGLGKKLLERYRWWLFQPHPEWITPHTTEENVELPYAAGIPGEVRVFYFPYVLGPRMEMPIVHGLESGVQYQAFYFNPATGEEQSFGQVIADAAGNWKVPQPTAGQDIVLVLERQ